MKIHERVMASFGPDDVMGAYTVAMRTRLPRRSVVLALGRLKLEKKLHHHGYDQYSLHDHPEAVFGDQDKVWAAFKTLGTGKSFTTKWMRDQTGLPAAECLKAIHQLVERKKLAQHKRGVYGSWN